MTLALYEHHSLLLSDVSLGMETYFVLKFWLAMDMCRVVTIIGALGLQVYT